MNAKSMEAIRSLFIPFPNGILLAHKIILRVMAARRLDINVPEVPQTATAV